MNMIPSTTTPIYEDTIPAGCHWSFIMPAGYCLRLTDVEGGANVGMLLYNPAQLLERLNIPDTLKCQHTFQLTTGHCLYSDMGRVFCSIIDDSFGWHDSVCGTCDKALVEMRWGKSTYQLARNAMHRNGRDGFLIELAKYGLGKKDLAANLNWFSKVAADSAGNIRLEKNTHAGAYIELLFEMETLVIMHTSPHPLDDSSAWPAKPVNYRITKANKHSSEYPTVLKRSENSRGLLNNMLYQLSCCSTDCCGEGRP